ncbi:MAG: hypothetical protein AAF799_31045 [Myxococcota bacterium]
MAKRSIRIIHRPSGAVIAEGPRGWAITPFEGNYYVSRRCLRQGRFRASFIPGLCFYKFLYLWLHYEPPGATKQERSDMLGWIYVLPNPLFPFIAFRVAVPGQHPDIAIAEFETVEDQAEAASGVPVTHTVG